MREKIAYGVGDKDAERGECAGHAGDEDAGDAERTGHGAGVERACSAEAEQREFARIVAAFHGDDADGFLHDSFGEQDDAGGEVLEAPEAAALRSHQRAGAIEVEAGPAAKEELGVEAAEDEVGVGDGGLIAGVRNRWARARRRRTRDRHGGCLRCRSGRWIRRLRRRCGCRAWGR